MSKLKYFFIFLLILTFAKVRAEKTYPQPSQPDKKFLINNIFIKGNKHTKKYIILREIEVKKGDSVTLKELAHKLVESRHNLLNRSLFNFVNIKPEITASNRVNIYVSVVERWYIWPIPIIRYTDRNFNVWWAKKEMSHVDYGIYLKVNNFRGRMETLTLLLQNGYNKSAQLSWENPYINKRETWGVGIEGGVIFNHDIDYNNINDKLVFYGETHNFVRKHLFFTLIATYRPGYKALNTFSLSFNHYNFVDTLLRLNPSFAYGRAVFSYLSLHYNFKLDYRDYRVYPLSGYYLEIDLHKFGLGLFHSGVNYFSAYALYDRYIPIHRPWYFAYNFTVKIQPDRYRPYFLEKGLGYKPTTLRGYQLYVVNGQWITLFHSNLKYELVPKRIVQLPFIRSEKFGKLFYSMYANLIFDAGYISDNQTSWKNPLANKFIFGTGFELDFVTYYDMVFGFEYTINRENQKNFFISLVAPI